MPHIPTRCTTALVVALAGANVSAAQADGYVLGAGRWSCAETIEAIDGGDASLVGQAAGWIMGYWSAATFHRETGFIDIVEQVGGRTVYEKTVEECRKAPPETLLYTVADAMISNTK